LKTGSAERFKEKKRFKVQGLRLKTGSAKLFKVQSEKAVQG